MIPIEFRGEYLDIPVADGAWDQEIRIPGSKSLTNRALLIASLAAGETVLDGFLHSDDTRHMLACLKKLGIIWTKEGQYRVRIQGTGGRLGPCEEDLYVENAGTAARFLTAALTLGRGDYRLTGNKRMQERPIEDLITPLNALGCHIADENGTGCPPLRISARGFPGGKIEVRGEKSSQYISALMLAAPFSERETSLHIHGSLVSRTYVEMTRAVMEDFGAKCTWEGENRLNIARIPYQGRHYAIEGDASSASYFFAAAAITGGKVKVSGLGKGSTQGDLGLLGIFERMGCRVCYGDNFCTLEGAPLQAVEVDMNTMSDVAPTLAVAALFAKGKTVIKNVANMRIKECDRISAVVAELKKTGAKVLEWDDGLSVEGGGRLQSAVFDTYHDHRMAMSLALAGLKIPGITVKNPECVSKTFPDFFPVFFDALPGA